MKNKPETVESLTKKTTKLNQENLKLKNTILKLENKVLKAEHKVLLLQKKISDSGPPVDIAKRIIEARNRIKET